MEQELETSLRKEISHWKTIAAYLASCNAATLEDLPKRTQKSERARFQSICLSSSEMLKGLTGVPFSSFGTDEEKISRAAQRCENALKDSIEELS